MEANHDHVHEQEHEYGYEREDEDLNEVVDLVKRTIPEDQKRKFEGYAAEILSALGMDTKTPSTIDTPRRFIQALIDATEGYDGDPKLLKTFKTECHGEPDCRLKSGNRRSNPFLFLMRASCLSLLRRCVCRLYCA